MTGGGVVTDVRNSFESAWKAQEDVSRRLMDLYAVGTGLALAIGVERMVRFTDESDALIRRDSLPLFAALLATLVPFYHGALRHLHKRWIESHGLTPASMMVDFVMLFLGVGVMFAMGYVLTQPWTFAVALLTLLALDCLWAITFDYLVDRPTRGAPTRAWPAMLLTSAWGFLRDVVRGNRPADQPELNWLWLNAWSLALAVPALAAVSASGVRADSVGFSSVVMLFALARTLMDYWVNADFYFPVAAVRSAAS
jgi:hypothetical protein